MPARRRLFFPHTISLGSPHCYLHRASKSFESITVKYPASLRSRHKFNERVGVFWRFYGSPYPVYRRDVDLVRKTRPSQAGNHRGSVDGTGAVSDKYIGFLVSEDRRISGLHYRRIPFAADQL